MRDKQKIDKKLSKEISKKYFIGLIISVILFIFFLEIGSKVKGSSTGIYFDENIISYIHNVVTPNMKELMIFFSFIGSTKFYIFISIIALFYFFKKKYYVNVIAFINGVLGSAFINFLTKQYYIRIRPEKYFQIKETGFSFPSGHSMVAVSSYFILTYLLFRKKTWNLKKIIIWTFTVILSFLIGFSRIYLGVHWPTDVIAGFSLGIIWVYVNIIIVELLNRK